MRSERRERMSDDVASAVAADKATTEAATSGPWTFAGMDCHEHNPYVQIGRRDSTTLLNADAVFIAAARSRWPVYIAAIEAVTALCEQADAKPDPRPRDKYGPI